MNIIQMIRTAKCSLLKTNMECMHSDFIQESAKYKLSMRSIAKKDCLQMGSSKKVAPKLAVKSQHNLGHNVISTF